MCWFLWQMTFYRYKENMLPFFFKITLVFLVDDIIRFLLFVAKCRNVLLLSEKYDALSHINIERILFHKTNEMY